MVEKKHDQIWSKVRECLREEMTGVSFKTWVDPMTPVFADDTVFILSVPDEFSLDHVSSFIPLFQNAFVQVCSRNYKVELTVKDSQEMTEILRSYTKNSAPSIKKDANKKDANLYDSSLNPLYDFENFVVGSGNRFAHAACVAVAERLGGRNYNPLFLYGGSGLGKTHLMHAIGNYVCKNQPEKRVIYVQCEKFVNEFISTIQRGAGAYESFRDKYRNADLLLFDDIQFLEGKEQMLEEFFYTFNALHESGKHIVMTCDKPPQSLSTLEERLRTRFSSGLTVDIQPPDYETRVAILNKRAQQNSAIVPDDVFDYIASNIATNIRELDGAFNTVIAYSLLSGNINLETAVKALKDIIQAEPTPVSSDLIIDVVARYYHVSSGEILSNKRSKDVTVPRQVAMYLCRYVMNMTFPRIGKVFGGRDHSTVMHACNKVSADINSRDSSLSNDIEEIKKRL